MANLRKSITIILNTKGGVGKSTTSLQVITPYLYNDINNITDYNIINAKNTKVRIYDIDARNRSSDILSNSKIFESILIEKCDSKLENILNQELNSFTRDYPIVFDIGNTFTEQFIEIFGNIFTDKTINFLIPVKQDEDDARNALNVYKLLDKNIKQNCNISLVLSDSIADINNLNELKSEFEIILGDYWDEKHKKMVSNFFETGTLENSSYFAVKKTIRGGNLLVRSKVWTRKTIYENAMLSQEIKSNPKHKINLSWLSLKKEGEIIAEKNPNDPKLKTLQNEFYKQSEFINIYNNCYNYYMENLLPTFELLSKKSIIV